MKKNVGKKTTVRVLVYEEKKLFAKSHMAGAIGITVGTLNRWIEKGKIPGPSGPGNKYTGEDIEQVFNSLSFRPSITIKRKGDLEYWEDCKACALELDACGIFLRSLSCPKNSGTWATEVQRLGLWSAQYLCNHIDFYDFLDNPVMQLVAAREMASIWIEKIRLLEPAETVLIVNYGKTVSTIYPILLHKSLPRADKLVPAKLKNYNVTEYRLTKREQ